jgi:hypothetical protein
LTQTDRFSSTKKYCLKSRLGGEGLGWLKQCAAENGITVAKQQLNNRVASFWLEISSNNADNIGPVRMQMRNLSRRYPVLGLAYKRIVL